ncbi:MAG: M48 family metallopeptidase [Telluria sp.]
MKYQGSLPEHNDNVSHEHPLKDFVLILSLLAVGAVLAFWLLDGVVDVAVDRLSPEAEAKLNSMIALKLDDMPKADPVRQPRVQALVSSMQKCAGLAARPTVTMHKSADPNAAIAPGGNIIVFTGLLDRVRSENGLSFVLAHELAHTANRDHLRAMGRGIVLFGIAAVLTGSNSGLTEMLAPVSHLGRAKYSREREAFADARALQILHCRYGHAGGATELFEALKGEDARSFELSHYLASHPSMQSRIDALKQAIREQGMKEGSVAPLF